MAWSARVFVIAIAGWALVCPARPWAADRNPSEMDKLIAEATERVLARPNSFEAYIQRAYLYRESGRMLEALWDYNRAIEINAGNSAAFIGRGFARSELGEDLKALGDLERAVDLKPDYALAYNARGAFYARHDRPEKAEADFRKAIQLDPKLPDGYNNLGLVLFAAGQRKEGLALLKRAGAIDRRNHPVLCNLGKAYFALGNLDDAEQCYDQVLEIYPRHAAARHHRALIRHLQKRYEQAEADYQKLAELSPDYEFAGEAYRRCRKRQPADGLDVPDLWLYLCLP